VLHQKMVVAIDCVGGGQVKVAANPVYMSAAEQQYKPAPSFGQNTEEVLSGLLHYSNERIAGLRRDKVIQP
jgi:crotonobetainyl-CoA:carnitine CoA-transferase CaiB-like acyl-CoA transferase